MDPTSSRVPRDHGIQPIRPKEDKKKLKLPESSAISEQAKSKISSPRLPSSPRSKEGKWKKGTHKSSLFKKIAKKIVPSSSTEKDLQVASHRKMSPEKPDIQQVQEEANQFDKDIKEVITKLGYAYAPEVKKRTLEREIKEETNEEKVAELRRTLKEMETFLESKNHFPKFSDDGTLSWAKKPTNPSSQQSRNFVLNLQKNIRKFEREKITHSFDADGREYPLKQLLRDFLDTKYGKSMLEESEDKPKAAFIKQLQSEGYKVDPDFSNVFDVLGIASAEHPIFQNALPFLQSLVQKVTTLQMNRTAEESGVFPFKSAIQPVLDETRAELAEKNETEINEAFKQFKLGYAAENFKSTDYEPSIDEKREWLAKNNAEKKLFDFYSPPLEEEENPGTEPFTKENIDHFLRNYAGSNSTVPFGDLGYPNKLIVLIHHAAVNPMTLFSKLNSTFVNIPQDLGKFQSQINSENRVYKEIKTKSRLGIEEKEMFEFIRSNMSIGNIAMQRANLAEEIKTLMEMGFIGLTTQGQISEEQIQKARDLYDSVFAKPDSGQKNNYHNLEDLLNYLDVVFADVEEARF